VSRADARCARRPRGGACLAVAVASVLLVGTLLGFVPPAGGESPDPFAALDLLRPREPETAKDFRAVRSDGGSVSLADHDGEVVLVNFWATWCPL
jgi:thiol-disulfide isomerase/thioredoxin